MIFEVETKGDEMTHSSITVLQSRHPNQNLNYTYTVEKTVNYTGVHVGELLTKERVDDLIDGDINVTIKGPK